MDYETITIPKGTVLFRGMHNTSTITSDFAGNANGDSFCIHENYNVFFYPFPFVLESVAAYRYMVIYVTTRDLSLVNLIIPSTFNRQSRQRETGGIVSCNKLPPGCGFTGREYDPCLDYTKVPKNTSGMIAIAKTDANTLRSQKLIFKNWANKYFTTYKDSRNVVGVPEIILHPRVDKTPRTETIPDFKSWYRENKSDFIYNYLHVMSSEPTGVQKLMDEFMSEDGLDLGDDEAYHLKVNKKTGFFQVDELSNNQSELLSPGSSLNPTADMVLKQKSLYKMISDKYPKADTIPVGTNTYDTQPDMFTESDNVHLFPGPELKLSKFFDKPKSTDLVRVPERRPIVRDIYYINGKRYVFLPTPAGREIEEQASLTNDPSFFTKRGFLEKHPINREMSAYELMSVAGENIPSDTPARHINGVIQYYHQKDGLLGSSRRATLRRRRLLKSR